MPETGYNSFAREAMNNVYCRQLGVYNVKYTQRRDEARQSYSIYVTLLFKNKLGAGLETFMNNYTDDDDDVIMFLWL